jgi:Cytochrome P460
MNFMQSAVLATGAALVAFSGFATLAQHASELAPVSASSVGIPADFRSTMAHYATVERADGKLYELFVNEIALDGWLSERRLPAGSVFAIESFNAERNAEGEVKRDDMQRMIKGESDHEVHLSTKQNSWQPNGECTSESLMNGTPMGLGQWRVTAFDPRDGQRIQQASHPPGECHQCHTDRRGEDFILSRGLLDSYARIGQVARIAFACGERDICFSGPAKPLSVPVPICEATFRP